MGGVCICLCRCHEVANQNVAFLFQLLHIYIVDFLALKLRFFGMHSCFFLCIMMAIIFLVVYGLMSCGL